MLIDPWRFTLLGRFEACMGERTVTRFRTYKTGALLAYLALAPDREYGRDELVERFWPDDAPENALRSLRVALASLRSQLEPSGILKGEILIATKTTISLRSEAITTDVAAFENACNHATSDIATPQRLYWCKRAIELYGGALLPGYSDSWTETERLRLQNRYCVVLRGLSDLYLVEGDPDSAVHACERIVTQHPGQEEAHYELIRLLIHLERPHAALQQFRNLQEILRKERGHPSEKILSLIQPLLKDRLLTVPTDPNSRRHRGKTTQVEERKEFATVAAPVSVPAPSFHPIPQRQVRLPLRFDRFFGRESERVTLCTLLTEGHIGTSEEQKEREEETGNRETAEPARLVTIIGPAGSGKTRLAIEAARRLSETITGSIGFVSLADLRAVDDIVVAARDALCPERGASRSDPLRQIAEILGDAPALLILDNYEHLLPAGAIMALRLLETSPGLRLLVTSRRSLELRDERLLPLGPLAVPGEEHPGRKAEGLSSLLRYPSIQLFMERSRAKRPDFHLASHNARAVAALCRRLDGLPLAIELAAARSGALTPAQMLAQLEDRFPLLISRYVDQPERHRSLYIAIDSSYSTLSPDLQQFFARLCVFRGSFTLEACDYVAGAGNILTLSPSYGDSSNPVPDVQRPASRSMATLDLLTELQESSLIVAEAQGETMRFRLLETLREFAGLCLSKEERYELARRHADYFRALIDQAAPHWGTAKGAEWLERLEADLGNLRAALDQTLSAGEVEAHLNALTLLGEFWRARGYLREGRERLERALTAYPEPSLIRAGALNIAASLASYDDDYRTALRYSEEAVEWARQIGNSVQIANALMPCGHILTTLGELTRARILLEESVARFEEVGNQHGMARALHTLGLVMIACDRARARDCFERSLALREGLQDRYGMAFSLNMIAALLVYANDTQGARLYVERAWALFHEHGDRRYVESARILLGKIHYREGNDADAEACWIEALETSRALNSRIYIGIAQTYLSSLRLRQCSLDEARFHIREALPLLHEIGNKGYIQEALDVCVRLAEAEGDFKRAAWLLGCSHSIGISQNNAESWVPYQSVDIDPVIDSTQSALGEARFNAYWNAGGKSDLQTAIRVAMGERPARSPQGRERP